MEDIAIRCRGIKKSYGKKETRIDALKGIDLDILRGQLTLLVGPSGSGKSTLLSIITTILTPDEGELYLLGKEIFKMPENERAHFCLQNLGIVFQSLFLIPTLTVEENVSLPLLIAGFNEHDAAIKSKELLGKMDLASRANISPYDLSKGQQQRVAIARAMVNNSKIIVCDEPTSSLDQVSGANAMQLLREIALEPPGRAVLVVTHDHRTFPFADRIINMNDGQIVSEGINE